MHAHKVARTDIDQNHTLIYELPKSCTPDWRKENKEERRKRKEEKERKQKKKKERKNKIQSNKDDADIHAQVRQSQSLFIVKSVAIKITLKQKKYIVYLTTQIKFSLNLILVSKQSSFC